LWPAPVQSVLGCKIPHERDALKWKAIGRRRRYTFNSELKKAVAPSPLKINVGVFDVNIVQRKDS
jgi:hypothetical protein